MGGRLEGKVAIVTGVAAGGIAAACALLFARQGARVVGCDINEAGARETAQLARKEGLEIDVQAPVDLTTEAGAASLVAHTVKTYGGIDVLANIAGHAEFATIDTMTLSQWRNTMVGELDIIFLLVREAWPHLVKRGGGSIINMGSASGHRALAVFPQLAHATGKGGVIAMTRQLAYEGAPHNIRVNSISPGIILSAAVKGAFQAMPEFEPWMTSRVMLNRLGQPEDIAQAAVFLASDESPWVTGAEFPIDGGQTAW